MKKFLMFLSVFMVGSLTSLGIVWAMGNATVEIFPDVDYNDYYGFSLLKMQQRDVINGYNNGTFGPHDAVTRAQFVTMLDRYDESLFNTKYDSKSNGVVYLLCDGLNRNQVSAHYQDYYDDLCKQQILLVN